MSNDINQFIDKYAKAIQDDNAAIFAGAGLSIPAGHVSWKVLLKKIADELNLEIEKETDLVAVAQYHVNEHGNNRHGLNQVITDQFVKGKKITDNHRILSSLPIKVYWTTNYDPLIEKALEKAGKTPDVKIVQENLSVNVPRRDAVVYKMHGDVSQPHDAVITKDDYEGYNEKRQLFTTTLQGDLVSKTFLFIGFSFDDPNIEYILSRIRVLLGTNKRDHYCFFKKLNRKDFKTTKEYNYAQIRHRLRIGDLKRYSINAILVDDYPQITDILQSIKKKVLRSNIFISGAAASYHPKSEKEALDFVHKLGNRIAAKGYKIVSGFGNGIGSAVINGAIEHHFSTNYRHLDEAIILRPFPQVITGTKNRDALYTEYRQEMLKNAGLALFIYGNKLVKGNIEPSDGMEEEFRIAKANGAIPIPIGVTGFMAETLWKQVMTDYDQFYPSSPKKLKDIIKKLGNNTLDDESLIKLILEAVEILQSHF